MQLRGSALTSHSASHFLLLLVLLTNIISRPVAGEPSYEMKSVPLTFLAAIERALARNPTVAVARTEIDRAESLVRQARASSFPVLNGTMTYTRLDGDRSLADRIVAGAGSFTANVSLSVPLLNFQRWYQWRHARDNVLQSRASADDVRRQVALATARAYLVVLAQRRTIEVAERARDTARAHLSFAQKRLAAGAGNRIDVVRAAQEVASDEAQVEVAYGAMARAREALGVLLGVDGPIDCAEEPRLEGPRTIGEALARVEGERADIKSVIARRDAVRSRVDDRWTDYLPYVNGAFQPFFQDPPSLTQPQTGWQAQLILTIPFYDGGLRYGQQREQRAQLAAAEATLEGILRQARAEVRSAFTILHRADQALAAARDAARLGAEAFELSNRAYQAGATNSLEIIDAARRARDAETTSVIAEDAARQARLDLLLASGRFP